MRCSWVVMSLVCVVILLSMSAGADSLSVHEHRTLLSALLDACTTEDERESVLASYARPVPTALAKDLKELGRSRSQHGKCGFTDELVAYGVAARLGERNSVLWHRAKARSDWLRLLASNEHFEVWGTTVDDPGTPDDDESVTTPEYAEEVLGCYSKVYETEVVSWGYRPGASWDDKAEPPQPAEKFQVWIMECGESAGLASQFRVNASAQENDPRTFCVNKIDDDLDSWANWLPDLLAVCAHEYHHASQVAYLLRPERHPKEYKWFMEGSAAWIEPQVGRNYWDIEVDQPVRVAQWFGDRVSYWCDNTTKGLTSIKFYPLLDDTEDDYDACAFFHFLSDNRLSGSLVPDEEQRAVVLRFWEAMGERNDWDASVRAFDDALRDAPQEYNTMAKCFDMFLRAFYRPSAWFPDVRLFDVSGVRVVIQGDPDEDRVTENLSPGDRYTNRNESVSEWGAAYWVFEPDASVTDMIVKVDGEDNRLPWGNLDAPSYQVLVIDTDGDDDSVLSSSSSREVDHVFRLPLAPSADKVVLIVAALEDGGDYDITVEALVAPPSPEILSPTESAPLLVGPPDSPNKVYMEATMSTDSGTFITGLAPVDFTVRIGGGDADVLAVVEQKEAYDLTIRPPTQNEDGLYDLSVTVDGQTDTEVDAIQYASGPVHVDVVLVIDKSGSMAGDYIAAARNAAKLFVDQMVIGDQVGVVSFDDSATVNFELTEIDDASVKAAAKTAIDGISSGGGTHIGNGLIAGQGQLDTRGSAIDPWAMILLSDGQGEMGNAMAMIVPKKTRVYSVALGTNSDEALLQDIAEQTDGQYFLAPDEQELAGIYNSLSGHVTGRQTLVSEELVVEQGSTAAKTVRVDSSVSEAVFSISWPGTGHDLDLTLEDPSGNVIDSTTTDPQITFASTSNSETFTVVDPAPGLWTVRVFGRTKSQRSAPIPLDLMRDRRYWKATGNGDLVPDMELLASMVAGKGQPKAGIDCRMDVTAKTDLAMVAYLDQPAYEQGEPILLSVVICDDQPIAGASVSSRITAPSSPSTLTLHDDGMHGDAAAEDGIYANWFARTSAVGTYAFDIEATGTSTSGDAFNRVAYASTFVAAAGDTDGDGMPNNWELEVGLDPSVRDAGEDPDGDGLTNLQEYQNGTDPLSSDTDADGLRDWSELNAHGTDPIAADTDGGGESDGSEVTNARDPLDPRDDGQSWDPDSTDLCLIRKVWMGSARDVAVAGDFAYVVSEQYLSVFDISEGAIRRPIAQIRIPGNPGYLAIRNDSAFIADWGADRDELFSLTRVDLSEPSPTFLVSAP